MGARQYWRIFIEKRCVDTNLRRTMGPPCRWEEPFSSVRCHQTLQLQPLLPPLLLLVVSSPSYDQPAASQYTFLINNVAAPLF